MDRTAPRGGLKFVAAFALWATIAFVPAWAVSHRWQRMIATVAARIVAPAGHEIEFVDLELFFPIDLAVFVALTLASGWSSWPGRSRALLVGIPVMVTAEVAVLAAAMAALMTASAPGGAAWQDEASRLADALIRASGLALAALVWFGLVGRERFAVPGPRHRGPRAGTRLAREAR